MVLAPAIRAKRSVDDAFLQDGHQRFGKRPDSIDGFVMCRSHQLFSQEVGY